MWPYIIAFAFPAILAMLQPIQKPWNSLKIWVPTAIFYIVFVGLRHEVGGDWFNYLDMFDLEAFGMSYKDAFFHGDPAYWLIQVWTHNIGEDIYFVNLIVAVIFIVGLIVFIRRLPNPWLALTITMAYTVLTLGMGYVRQGGALGLSLWAITALMDRKFVKFFILIVLAAAFHKSAVIMLGFGLFQGGKGKYMKTLAAIILGVGIYAAFMSGEEKHLVSLYIDNKAMQSSGAYIRALMNVVAAFIFLYYRKLWKRLWPKGYVLWMLMALGSFAAFGAVWFYSTAVDRVSLYFIPLQIAVFASLPVLLRGKLDPKLTTFLVIAYYGLVYFVWLGFASWSFAWVPYQNILLMD
jgi:hypothetical protein